MNRPLIALDARLYGRENTGDSTYWTGLIDALGSVDSEFQFLLLSNYPRPSEVPDSLRWEMVAGGNSRWLSLVSLPLAARRAGSKLFHTQYNLSPLAKGGVTTIHDVSFFVGPEWFRHRDRVILQRFIPASARRAKRVITVSETSKSEIVRFLKIPSEKVSVTPLGVSASFHPRDHAHVESVLHKYGVDEPYVLTVGARWPRKNVELAIRAMERLSERFPHKLVVAGRMDLSDFGDSKRVVGTGWVGHDDLPALFSRASLYLCPSRHEGFGLPIVEAFASGVPVLSSCGGSLREVGGEAAMYVDDWEVSSWSAAIERVLDDSSKLNELRAAGLERVKEFSWERTANLTLEAYRKALK